MRFFPATLATLTFAALLAAIIFASEYRTVTDHLAYQRGAETVDEWNARRDAFLEKTDPVSRLWQWLRPVPAQMPEAQITELPSDWVSRDTARRDFFKDWCSRPDTPKCDDMDDDEVFTTMHGRDFIEEFKERREIYLRILTKPGLQGSNLSEANLVKAHLPGVTLTDADLSRVNLVMAQLEGANMRRARLEGAKLNSAQMDGVYLTDAKMEGAVLHGAHLAGAFLIDAQMEGAFLSGAKLEGANLGGTQMEGVDLSGAQMNEAFLFGARIANSDLSGAQLQFAALSHSFLSGSEGNAMVLSSTNLQGATNGGGAFRYVDFSTAIFSDATDFRNAFFDGTSKFPPEFRSQNAALCQLVLDKRLPEVEFMGRWRGWISLDPDEESWASIAPDGFEDVPPIPPDDPNCRWKG